MFSRLQRFNRHLAVIPRWAHHHDGFDISEHINKVVIGLNPMFGRARLGPLPIRIKYSGKISPRVFSAFIGMVSPEHPRAHYAYFQFLTHIAINRSPPLLIKLKTGDTL
jgi:hypothetical protein